MYAWKLEKGNLVPSLSSILINAKYMVHGVKPHLVGRVASQYARYLLGSRPRLRYVDFILHYDCNLRCEHCSCESLKDEGRDALSPGEWGDVARQAQRLGAIIFGLQGGEPLLYPNIEEIIREIDASRNYISVKTNGTIATEKLYIGLKRMGVDSVTVGFGPIPNDFGFDDYNDTSRKLKDAFALSLKSVGLLHQCGIKPMMSVVISRKNIRSKVFMAMIELARQYGSVLNCALAVPVGCWERDYELMLTDEDRLALREIMRQHSHVRTDFETNWGGEGCGALKEKIYISPYGDVLPCPFIHISFGNVRDEPLEAIWRRGISTRAFGEYPSVCIAAEDRHFLSYLDIASSKGVKLPIQWNDPDITDLLSTSYESRKSTDVRVVESR